MGVMDATEELILTAVDRCDHRGCNAQAYFLTIFDNGNLSWCHHHFRKNEVALRSAAYHMVDQSDTLS